MATPGSGNPHTRLALGAAVVLCLLVVLIAAAGAESGSGDPKATASAKVKKKIKKLNRKFKKLQAQLEEVSKQPGPQGLQGEKGDKGDPGSLTGPAGGDLTGNYPDPSIAGGAVTIPKLAFDPATQAELNSHKGSGDHDSRYWKLAGNGGTNPASQFLGTTDDTPLNLRVNDSRALRLEPAVDISGGDISPNVIGGKADNAVTGGVFGATIGGGGRASPGDPDSANRVTDEFGTIGGGAGNQAGDDAGGTRDKPYATVGGGFLNSATGNLAAVGGGVGNIATRESATVGGGDSNAASGLRSTVSGGDNNTANGSHATVGGGDRNAADSFYGTVPGGRSNTAGGTYSLAAGRRAQADHNGSFVWADAFDFDFASTAANQFSARATGGARFVSAIDGAGNPTAGVTLAPGGGSWASLSDESSKQGIVEVSGRKVLARLASIPVSEWSYRAQAAEVRHIGPMAQDFHRAFRVGEDPRHIASLDTSGVALAAIKELKSTVGEQERHIALLESRISALERGGR